jgi:hypothetical protein
MGSKDVANLAIDWFLSHDVRACFTIRCIHPFATDTTPPNHVPRTGGKVEVDGSVETPSAGSGLESRLPTVESTRTTFVINMLWDQKKYKIPVLPVVSMALLTERSDGADCETSTPTMNSLIIRPPQANLERCSGEMFTRDMCCFVP